MPPVAAMLPAVSDASDVVSMLSTSPLAALSCPFLSTMKTTLAFASLTRRSTTVWIWLNSSSYITIWGLTIASLREPPTQFGDLLSVHGKIWQKPEPSLLYERQGAS